MSRQLLRAVLVKNSAESLTPTPVNAPKPAGVPLAPNFRLSAKPKQVMDISKVKDLNPAADASLGRATAQSMSAVPSQAPQPYGPVEPPNMYQQAAQVDPTDVLMQQQADTTPGFANPYGQSAAMDEMDQDMVRRALPETI